MKPQEQLPHKGARHRSFKFQEFHQRYTEALEYIPCKARRQDNKNRQNSIDDLSENTKNWFKIVQEDNWNNVIDDYKKALELGIAKEQARFLLPLNTKTKLYMTSEGILSSWIHYIQLREKNGTQKEHMDIALECRTSVY